MYHLSIDVPNLFHYCLPKGLFRHLPSNWPPWYFVATDILCISVCVQWPFGESQTIISEIIFTLPRTSFHPLWGDATPIENAWGGVDIWGGGEKLCYAWLVPSVSLESGKRSVFAFLCQIAQKETLASIIVTLLHQSVIKL